MIVGYHIIFGAYGFWLPNDPRGSWSDVVRAWHLLRFGPATKTVERRSLAHRPHDHRARLEAKKALVRPAVNFTGLQARDVARGFADYFRRVDVPVFACAILPDHVHIVTGPLHIPAEQLAIQLKVAATRELAANGRHPFQQLIRPNGRLPKCFARGEWKVFLDPPDMPRAIAYVEHNPLKEGKPRQTWSFVQPYDG